MEIMEPTEKQRCDLIMALHDNYGISYIKNLYLNNIYPFREGDPYPDIKKFKQIKSGNRTTDPKHYEICLTHPDKDSSARNKVLKWIEKNYEPIEFEAHFEIGKKSGNYHTHCYLKTTKKLRKSNLKSQCKKFKDGEFISVSHVKDIDDYKTYISKDDHLIKPEGWENYVLHEKTMLSFK